MVNGMVGDFPPHKPEYNAGSVGPVAVEFGPFVFFDEDLVVKIFGPASVVGIDIMYRKPEPGFV